MPKLRPNLNLTGPNSTIHEVVSSSGVRSDLLRFLDTDKTIRHCKDEEPKIGFHAGFRGFHHPWDARPLHYRFRTESNFRLAREDLNDLLGCGLHF